MKAVVAAFNQEKALVGAFTVLTNLRMDLFQALAGTPWTDLADTGADTSASKILITAICSPDLVQCWVMLPPC